MTDIDPSKVKAGDTVTVEVEQHNGDTYSVTGKANLTSNGYLWVGPIRIDAGAIEAYPARITDHQPAMPKWEQGTAGTATVLYDGDVSRAATRIVFRTAGVIAPGRTTRPWVDELGNLLADDEVTDFVPDDADELRGRLAGARAGAEKLCKKLEAEQRERNALVEQQRCEIRGWQRAQVLLQARAEDAEAENERLRAARTLPTREQVADALRTRGGVTLWHAHGTLTNRSANLLADRVLALFEQGGAAKNQDAEGCPDDCGGCACHIAPPCSHCVEHTTDDEA